MLLHTTCVQCMMRLSDSCVQQFMSKLLKPCESMVLQNLMHKACITKDEKTGAQKQTIAPKGCEPFRAKVQMRAPSPKEGKIISCLYSMQMRRNLTRPTRWALCTMIRVQKM